MGLIADLAQLTANTTAYATALKKAYDAAVLQLQVTADLEAKARSAALAMVNASQQTALAAAKMQQVVTAGVNGMGQAQQEAIRALATFNPSSYQNSKYIQSGDKQQAGLHYTEARFAGLTDELIDSNAAVKSAVDAFANYKLDTARNGRLETNINVLVDQLKKQGMSAQDIQTAVRPQYAELERLRGEYSLYLNQLKEAVSAAVAIETAATEAKAAQQKRQAELDALAAERARAAQPPSSYPASTGSSSSSGGTLGITININAANALQLSPDFAESLARQLKPQLDALARRSA